ncbi:MAG: YlxR family protein [Pseudobutyrivibrio sp.]|nr:YlxR family protein [Pseudobutyrivibrio sp.]
MSEKTLPLRKCVACGQMLPKDQLFRIVKSDDGIKLDLSYKCMGRGAYICRDAKCIDLAVKKKSFNRSLRGPVSNEVIDSLYMELENGSR